jgi:hypothetical protein
LSPCTSSYEGGFEVPYFFYGQLRSMSERCERRLGEIERPDRTCKRLRSGSRLPCRSPIRWLSTRTISRSRAVVAGPLICRPFFARRRRRQSSTETACACRVRRLGFLRDLSRAERDRRPPLGAASWRSALRDGAAHPVVGSAPPHVRGGRARMREVSRSPASPRRGRRSARGPRASRASRPADRCAGATSRARPEHARRRRPDRRPRRVVANFPRATLRDVGERVLWTCSNQSALRSELRKRA